MTISPHAHGFTSEGALTPDRLYDHFEVRRAHFFKQGQGLLLRGTAVGKISAGEDSISRIGGSTGNGVLLLDPTAPLAAGYVPGTYTVRCVTSATGGGTFRVTSPTGVELGEVEAGATFAAHLRFTIASGGVDFVIGDGFDVTVTADAGKWVISNAGVRDGSEVIRGVLLHDINTDAGEPEGMVGRRGYCNPAALIFGPGHTHEGADDACLDRGIVFHTVIG